MLHGRWILLLFDGAGAVLLNRLLLRAAATLALAGCSNASRVGKSDAGIPSSGGAAGFAPSGGAGGGPLASSGGSDSGGSAAAGGLVGAGGEPAVRCRDGGEVASWPPSNDRPQDFSGPSLLSQTGLYSDIAQGTLVSDVRAYTPLASLWSDGASKRRWLKLPPGSVIDTSDMDDWIFPVDTKVFKEFTRDGKRIETRMIWKRGPGDIQMVSYIWNSEQTEAAAAPGGQKDALCTTHDVPDVAQCATCHSGRTDKLLGPTALQLSHPVDAVNYPGIDITDLISQGLLSRPPTAPLTLPGDPLAQVALAYLHANCGNCHNPKTPEADRLFSVYFWQRADSLAALENTVTYKSLVTDKNSPLWIDAVLDRMERRKDRYQMPPIASEERDEEGIAKVRALMEMLRARVPALPVRAQGGSCPTPDAVWQLFTNTPGQTSCTGTGFCHSGNAGNFSLNDASDLVKNAVGVRSMGPGCTASGLSLVEPGDPMRSLLYLKLLPGPPCGQVMPPTQALSADQLKIVYDFIASCKPSNSGVSQ